MNRDHEVLTPEDLVVVEFKESRTGPRYACGPVDDFLDRMIYAMRGDRLTSDLLATATATFDSERGLRPGYAARQVDDLIDRLREQVERAAVEPGRRRASLEELQRRDAWRATDERQPLDLTLDTLAAVGPQELLVISSPPAGFPDRVRERLPRTRLTTIDSATAPSPLPWPDGSFDAVCALWMIHQAPQVDQLLAELRRVLRPDGALLALANTDDNLVDLLLDAGGRPYQESFSRGKGDGWLRRHFDDVEKIDLPTRATFPDHAAAQNYLAALEPTLAGELPPFQGAREYAGGSTLFIATVSA